MLTKQTIPRLELEKILTEFELGQIEKFEPLETSGNITYCLTVNSKVYFLRLCPKGQRWRSQEEIRAEIELLEYLKSNNFPVITAIKNRDGEVVISWKNQHGYLREFIKAEAKMNPTFAEVEKFGKLVGWLHSLTENYKTENYREHIFDLSKTKQRFGESKPKILASDFQEKQKFVRQFEKEILSLNFSNNLPRGMIHEDLGKRHILWQEDRLVTLVDFDRSYFGRLVLDLGQAVRGWCFVDNWMSWNNETFETLIEGYQQKRNLTESEKESLINAIKFGILERSLSFCLNFIEITHHKDDQDFALDGVFRQLGLIEKNRKKIEKILVK
jgi:Ser/Thr protein kinase RdoA (MazF antagonist)